MRTSDFDYDLPPDRIAQRPAETRDSSRLLVLDRRSGAISHRIFHDLADLLSPGDVLVLNATRVLPARLQARKHPGGARVEVLLLRRVAPQVWEAWVGGRGLRTGRRLQILGGPTAEIIQELGGPRRLVRFDEPIRADLERIGEMPLPPYIKQPLRSPEEYQTVFARVLGSAAAPTAGLHFTSPLLERLRARRILLVEAVLHVGLDTFAPVTESRPEEHIIHTEWCQLLPEAAAAVNEARARGGRVVAVGTTAVRTLESAARAAPRGTTVAPFEGPTDLYILPGHEFRAVDALITNFHLPRSSLLMLVSAFAGRDRVLQTYAQAIEAGYRFYSFGDAMLIT